MTQVSNPPMPLPIPDLDSAPFWEGCRQGKLLLQRCSACGLFRYPPRPACPRCRSLAIDWVPSGGRGTVYSWVVVHHPVHPAVKDKVPYTLVLVELDEGPRLVSQLIEPPRAMYAGLPVEVVYTRLTDEITLPHFRCSDGGPGAVPV